MRLFLVACIISPCYTIHKGDSFIGKKDKLIEKLRSNPKSFTYAEAVSLLGYFDYQEDNKGKTSGSRVVFRKDATSAKFALHKPHPQKELKEYQAKDLLSHLEEEGLI